MPRLKYPKHDAALASALKDIGVHEEPMGSNTGQRVRTYQAATWLGGSFWPWCAAFCCYHAEQAGFKLPYRGAGAWAWYDWAKKSGWACTPAQAVPGDFVVWNFGSGHMSMLRAPVTGQTVATVDGNVSDSVALRERPLSLVRGFIHIPEKATTTPPAKPPVFEVVGAENGHKKIYVSGARAVGRKIPQILANHPLGVTIHRRPT